MPGNTFINFGKDVPDGESMQKDHPGTSGWIEISDWDFEIAAESSAGKGQGSAVGKAGTEGLNVSHYFDISSPTILSKIVTGTHFPMITIHMLKQTGETGKAPQTYFEVKVSEAFVSKVSTKGSGEDGTMSQDVTFTFKQIAVGYKPQANDGKLTTAIPFEWSLKGNELKTSISDKLK
jgi:type VI secretion system secreted protein Hcp